MYALLLMSVFALQVKDKTDLSKEILGLNQRRNTSALDVHIVIMENPSILIIQQKSTNNL